MSDLLLAGIAVVMAMACIRQLVRLDRLAREFRCHANEIGTGSGDIFQALADHLNLDKHQRILRAEALVTTGAFILPFCCLLGLVIVSW
ncbi:MAG: hypothetical protein OEU92_09000 [Alphaproteobacteria bacterium]|nr:hypothetical protein [Alphaproteobacteria bacterium]